MEVDIGYLKMKLMQPILHLMAIQDCLTVVHINFHCSLCTLEQWMVHGAFILIRRYKEQMDIVFNSHQT